MERREKKRYRVWFPMTVVTDDDQLGTAITYDVSTSGLLMACPGRLELETRVRLRFRITADEAVEREIAGVIKRVDEHEDRDGPWRYRLAVEFDVAQPDLEDLLQHNVETIPDGID